MLIKILPLFLALGLFLGNGGTPDEFDYIGAAKCKVCHNKAPVKAYTIWAEGVHAKAMESLEGDDAKNPECLSCHSTMGHVDEDYVTTLTEAEGVSCESCHGPGSAYKAMSVMKSREKSLENGLIIPTAEVCKKCHNDKSPHFKGFDFDEYSKKINHSKPTS